MKTATMTVCLWLAILTSPRCLADEPVANVEKLIQEAVSATGFGAPATQYRALFAAVGKQGLFDLQSSPHDSIAIQAAWEEVTLSVSEDDGPSGYHLDPSKLRWFL